MTLMIKLTIMSSLILRKAIKRSQMKKTKMEWMI